LLTALSVLRVFPSAQALVEAGVDPLFQLLRAQKASHYGHPTAKKLVALAKQSVSSGRAIAGRSVSLRVVYGASIRSCRPCPLRQQCQWNGAATAKPRQGSRLLHSLRVGPAPLLWRDWSRRVHRRACMQLVRHQRSEVSLSPPPAASPPTADMILTRSQRAHTRLAWTERLERNARPEQGGRVTIRLFGVPEGIATSFGRAPA
jgi:hypothetical protein